MADAALENAMNRRGSLASQINAQQQRLEELRRELQLVDEFIARWHTFATLDDDEPIIQAQSSVDKSPEKPKRVRPANPAREVVGDVVEELLREWGRPASRAELFAALKAHDIVIQGTNPEMVFSTMLWRMGERFERLPRLGYWLKGEPVPGSPNAMAQDLSDLLG